MAQTYPPGNRVGFRITLGDNGSVTLKGGAQYLDMLSAGMFGMDKDEIATRVVRAWLLYDTVDDAVVTRLTRFANLRFLTLTRTKVTDGGLAVLKELSNLDELSLERSPFTDACCSVLGDLRNLKVLRVFGTALTEKALRQLEQSLPGLQVIILEP